MTYDIARILMRKLIWPLNHPDDLAVDSTSSGWLMDIAGCHQDDLRYFAMPSGWDNVFWSLSHPDYLAISNILSGWLMDTTWCHPDDPESSGWHNVIWSLNYPDDLAQGSVYIYIYIYIYIYMQYLIRMTYGHCRMSCWWLTILPYLVRMT